MNQNNNQLQQSSQVSQEELAKTQVLNLNDVKELAKFERKTSKKPAVLFAIAGILSITLGLTYPSIMTALDGISTKENKPEEKEKYEEDKEILAKVEENKVTCTFVAPSNPDGTKGTATYELFYNEEDMLESYTMTLTIDPLEGNAMGLTSTQALHDSYKAIDQIPITGYKMTTSYTDTGMKAIAAVDLTKLDKLTLTPTHQAAFFAQVPFNLNDLKTANVQYLTSTNYICQ